MRFLVKLIRRRDITFVILILAELIFIFYLNSNLYKKQEFSFILSPIKKENIKFSENSSNSGLQHFYELVPNTKDVLKTDWLRYTAYLTYNSDGLNERSDYSVEKPKNTFRILTIGDSFTFGAWVSTVDNYPEQLENLLNTNLKCKTPEKFEVINLGVGGYDIQYTVERFKRRGIKYQPDIVLWFLHDHNFIVINEKLSAYTEMVQKERASKGGDKYAPPLPNTPLIRKLLNEFLEKEGVDSILQNQKKFIEELDRVFKGKLVFLYFPSFNDAYKSILKNFAEKRNGTYLREVPDIYKEGLFLPDRHPSKEGYAVIADNLFQYLKGIVPCQ